MDRSAAEPVGNECTEEETKCISHDSCKEINSDSEDSSIKSAAWPSAGNNQLVSFLLHHEHDSFASILNRISSIINFRIIKRKLHKSYVATWSTQISQNGFAKCLIERCNFISLDLQIMQEHYRTCDGVSFNLKLNSTCTPCALFQSYFQVQNLETNLCPFCKNRLPSEDELSDHKSNCKGKVQSDNVSVADNSTEKNPRYVFLCV